MDKLKGLDSLYTRWCGDHLPPVPPPLPPFPTPLPSLCHSYYLHPGSLPYHLHSPTPSHHKIHSSPTDTPRVTLSPLLHHHLHLILHRLRLLPALSSVTNHSLVSFTFPPPLSLHAIPFFASYLSSFPFVLTVPPYTPSTPLVSALCVLLLYSYLLSFSLFIHTHPCIPLVTLFTIYSHCFLLCFPPHFPSINTTFISRVSVLYVLFLYPYLLSSSLVLHTHPNIYLVTLLPIYFFTLFCFPPHFSSIHILSFLLSRSYPSTSFTLHCFLPHFSSMHFPSLIALVSSLPFHPFMPVADLMN